MLGILSGGNRTCAFNSTFTTTSASTPVTSATRTFRGGGTIKFDTVTTDSSAPEYNKNAGGWVTITEGLTLAMVDTDTLAVRAGLPVAGNKAQFNIRNNDGNALIEAVTLTKS